MSSASCATILAICILAAAVVASTGKHQEINSSTGLAVHFDAGCEVSLLQTHIIAEGIEGNALETEPTGIWNQELSKRPTQVTVESRPAATIFKWFLGRQVDFVTLRQSVANLYQNSAHIIAHLEDHQVNVTTAKNATARGTQEAIWESSMSVEGIIKVIVIIGGFVTTCVWCFWGCPPKCSDDNDSKLSPDKKYPKYEPKADDAESTNNAESPRKGNTQQEGGNEHP